MTPRGPCPLSLAQHGHHREQEGEGLAGARLGDADHVLSCANAGNGFLLDFGRRGDAHVIQDVQILPCDLQVGKRHGTKKLACRSFDAVTNVELSTFLRSPTWSGWWTFCVAWACHCPIPLRTFRWMAVYRSCVGSSKKPRRTGGSLPDSDPPCIILSTHRDIVCDPSLYNLARVEAGRPTTHIVLGTNLANKPWVRDLMAEEQGPVYRPHTRRPRRPHATKSS